MRSKVCEAGSGFLVLSARSAEGVEVEGLSGILTSDP